MLSKLKLLQTKVDVGMNLGIFNEIGEEMFALKDEILNLGAPASHSWVSVF